MQFCFPIFHPLILLFVFLPLLPSLSSLSHCFPPLLFSPGRLFLLLSLQCWLSQFWSVIFFSSHSRHPLWELLHNPSINTYIKWLKPYIYSSHLPWVSHIRAYYKRPQACSPGNSSPALLPHLCSPFLGPSRTAPFPGHFTMPYPATGLRIWMVTKWLSHITKQAAHQAIISFFFEWIWLKRRLVLDLSLGGCTGILTVPKPGWGDWRVRENNLL